MTKKVARILSVDGGGIRGMIPASLIACLEESIGPVSSKFHMIAGTSTGGILACGLTRPDKPLSGKELVEFYFQKGPNIFEEPTGGALAGLTGELYSAESLEKVLAELLPGNLSQVAQDLLVTSYDIENRNPFLFKSWKARGVEAMKSESAQFDFPIKSIARATSAAPTYFQPARVENIAKEQYAMVDGGVYANNPAMCAYVAARRLYPLADEYIVVSLGTGELKVPFMYDDAITWGIIGWARPLLDLMFSGVSDTVSYELDQLTPGVSHHRFQTKLVKASEDMDNVSEENLKALVEDAKATYTNEKERFDSLISKLKEPLTDRKALGYPGEQPSGSVPKVQPKLISIPNLPKTPVGGMIAGGTTGVALGAALGGPVGALVGGALGALGIKLIPEKQG